MEFLHENKTLFSQAISLVFEKTGIQPAITEKDYYVTMLLELLSKKLPHLVFKGGTSLSKCFKVINRFSEDIDLAMDSSLSQGQRKKVKIAISETCNELRLSILNPGNIRSRRDYNRYEIGYSSIIQNDNDVSSVVIIETSYITTSFPIVELAVHSYIGDALSEVAYASINSLSLMPFTMKVQKLDRTFIDKIFAICDYYLQGKSDRHSRHLYDIYKLFPLIEVDNKFRNLIQEVRKIRALSPICPSAKEGVDVKALIAEFIANDFYKRDYEDISRSLISDGVTYKQCIQTLKKAAEQLFK